jgi:Family of unknown function (DUF6252)
MTGSRMRATVLVGLSALLTHACGGGGTSPTSPTSGSTTTNPAPNPSVTLTFKVDGASVTATSVTATNANGILTIGGTDSSRSTTLSFALTPTSAGVGTYTLGPLSAANAQVLIGSPAAGWQAAVGIGSGTITINSLTSTSASGTFSFSLVAVAGSSATGTKSITEGVFNVTFTAVPSPTPTPSGGSTFTTLIDGVPWSSSLSRRATLTNNILGITGQDTGFRVITLAVPIGGGLSIPPSPPATISLDFTPAVHGTVTMVLGAQNWDNGHAGGAGTFTITSISATRVSGTFAVTLVSNPINVVPVPTAHLTNGQFDMALERF